MKTNKTIYDYESMLFNVMHGGGYTLVDGYAIDYPDGYQVSYKDVYSGTSLQEAADYIHRLNGTCGVWVENGTYYIDKSKNIKSLKKAINYALRKKQLSIYDWRNKECIYMHEVLGITAEELQERYNRQFSGGFTPPGK